VFKASGCLDANSTNDEPLPEQLSRAMATQLLRVAAEVKLGRQMPSSWQN